MEKVPMTAEGYAALEAEIKHLKSVERPRIIKQIAEALDTMDGSEGGRQLLRTLRLDGFTPGSMELFAGIAAKYRDVLAQA